jgi:hypothetical protein
MPRKKVIEEQLEKDVKKDLEEVDEDEVKDALEEVEEEGAGEAAGTRYLATLKLLKQQQLDVGGGGAEAAEAVGGVGGGGAEGAEGGPEAAELQRRRKHFAQDVAEAKRRRLEEEQQLKMDELQQKVDASRKEWNLLKHNFFQGHNAKLKAQHHHQMQEQQQMQQQQGSSRCSLWQNAATDEGSARAAPLTSDEADVLFGKMRPPGMPRMFLAAADAAAEAARATATAADAAAEASDDGGSGHTEIYSDDSTDGCQPPYFAN